VARWYRWRIRLQLALRREALKELAQVHGVADEGRVHGLRGGVGRLSLMFEEHVDVGEERLGSVGVHLGRVERPRRERHRDAPAQLCSWNRPRFFGDVCERHRRRDVEVLGRQSRSAND
jgi:hypothetical protein